MSKRQESGRSFALALDELAAWFEKKKRILPWRDEPTLYRVWISEIMLQQTQVVTVVPYFERFISKFPSIEILAAAPPEDVLAQWAGLGYYSRARNLHRAAKQIVAQGEFPRDRAGWLEIPGVGEYTAGAILSIALDQPEAILDGNVERVLSRVRKVTRAKGDAAYKERLWRLSRAFVLRAHDRRLRPSRINQALMELGATTCTPRKPLCVFCPLKGICRAEASGESEVYPPRKKPKKWVAVREELHCVFDGFGRVLLRQRESGEWRAGLWDLPSELPARAHGKSSGLLKKAECLGTVESRHVVTRHKITRITQVWRLDTAVPLTAAESGAPESGSESSFRWVSLVAPEVPVGSALKKTLMQVRERFAST